MFRLNVVLFFFILITKDVLGQEYLKILPPIVSTECIELGLCDTVDNYPTSTAQKLSQEYHYPKIAENRNKTWKFIINDHNQPIQRFRTERCKSRNVECSEMMSFIPNYEGVCHQRWTLKEMYYIDENGSYGTDYFKVPTCCSCKLYHTNK